MNKSNKELILEIVIMLVFLIIAIPAYANATVKYNENKEKLSCQSNISIDIKTTENNKVLKLTNLNNEKNNIRLILKISKYSNDYAINLDNNYIDLKTLTHSEDENNYYYNIGSYEIEKKKDIAFKLVLLESKVEEEYITYSFITETENC